MFLGQKESFRAKTTIVYNRIVWCIGKCVLRIHLLFNWSVMKCMAISKFRQAPRNLELFIFWFKTYLGTYILFDNPTGSSAYTLKYVNYERVHSSSLCCYMYSPFMRCWGMTGEKYFINITYQVLLAKKWNSHATTVSVLQKDAPQVCLMVYKVAVIALQTRRHFMCRTCIVHKRYTNMAACRGNYRPTRWSFIAFLIMMQAARAKHFPEFYMRGGCW